MCVPSGTLGADRRNLTEPAREAEKGQWCRGAARRKAGLWPGPEVKAVQAGRRRRLLGKSE